MKRFQQTVSVSPAALIVWGRSHSCVNVEHTDGAFKEANAESTLSYLKSLTVLDNTGLFPDLIR